MKHLFTNCRCIHFCHCLLSSSLYSNVPWTLGLVSRSIVTEALSLSVVSEGMTAYGKTVNFY